MNDHSEHNSDCLDEGRLNQAADSIEKLLDLIARLIAQRHLRQLHETPVGRQPATILPNRTSGGGKVRSVKVMGTASAAPSDELSQAKAFDPIKAH